MRFKTLAGFSVVLCLMAGVALAQTPPADLRWNESVRDEATRALTLAQTNPVRGLMQLRSLISRRQSPKPNERQKAWLTAQEPAVAAAATAAIQSEYDAAIAAKDVRSGLIVLTAGGLAIEGVLDGGARLVPLRNAEVDAPAEGALWRLEEVTFARSAGLTLSPSETLTPKPGHHLLIVWAKATNLSDGADHPRIAEFLAPGGGDFANNFASSFGFAMAGEAPPPPDTPFRYIDIALAFLVDRDGVSIPVGSVSTRGARMNFSVAGLRKPAIKLYRNQPTELALMFSVPDTGADGDYRLWLPGAPAAAMSARAQP